MGMLTKKGEYFANPQLGRAHEAASGESRGKKPEPAKGEHEGREPEPRKGSAHSVHIFVDDAGGHHTVAHHAHGVEHDEHGSLDEAMDHAKGQMEGGGEQDEPEGGDEQGGGLMQTLDSGY